MELKIYYKTEDGESFYKRTLPDEMISINLYLNDNGGGQIEYLYPHPDGKKSTRSDCLSFADDGVTYVEVNGRIKAFWPCTGCCATGGNSASCSCRWRTRIMSFIPP